MPSHRISIAWVDRVPDIAALGMVAGGSEGKRGSSTGVIHTYRALEPRNPIADAMGMRMAASRMLDNGAICHRTHAPTEMGRCLGMRRSPGGGGS